MLSLLAFLYLLAEKVSCSAVLSMKKVLYPRDRDLFRGVLVWSTRFAEDCLPYFLE